MANCPVVAQSGSQVVDLDYYKKPVLLARTRRAEFRISNVRLGKVVLAANLKGAPRGKMPFEPVYAPGTQDLPSARVFVVQPDRHLHGLSLKLRRPLAIGCMWM